jgi:probable F420-dependent oxidoreductase
MVKQFRFGVQCGGDRDRADFEQLARKIEALGYATLYLPDHFIDTQMAPLVGMAVAAEATKTLRVGALVFDNDYKHPAILAKEIATLDRLSDGRVELGIGAGWMKVDYDALGLPYDPAGVRVDRLEEGLAVIKGCWGPKPFSFSGEHYTITDYDGIPKPTQQPPPILVGGGGPRVLRLAGREADMGRGTGSTTSSCRSATSSRRSPTTGGAWPRPRHRRSGWSPRPRWTPASRASGRSTRSATSSSSGASAGV